MCDDYLMCIHHGVNLKLSDLWTLASQMFFHRRPLDEKLCERDLEAAITLSLLNNADGIKEQSPTSKGKLLCKM